MTARVDRPGASGSPDPFPPPAAPRAAPVRGRAGAALDLIPLGLAIVAEAAWISVAAGLVAEYTLQQPTLGIAGMAAFVVAGVVAARMLVKPSGDRWPAVALFLVAVGGLIGWLSDPAAMTTLTTRGVIPALGVNVAGWFAGVAVLRGFAHARTQISAATLATVFGVGIPCLAIAAVAGGMIAEPHRARFLADATVAVVVFTGAATLALAIARLTAVGADSGFDWRRNPTWVALLVVIVVTTLAVAVPASIASPVIALVAGASVGPLLLIGLIIGFNRGTIRTMVLVAVGAILVIGVLRLLGGSPIKIDLGLGGSPGTAEPTPEAAAVAPIGLLVILAAAVILVLVLARVWARRTIAAPPDLDETREIDRSEAATTIWPWRRRRGARADRSEPRDAVGAYLRLLGDLESRPSVRREPAETPARHAARLRAARQAGLSLDLLAADYALVRFGGVALSPSEERRAIGRWRRLRSSVGGPAAPSKAPRTD